jgi:hypothetical protein
MLARIARGERDAYEKNLACGWQIGQLDAIITVDA